VGSSEEMMLSDANGVFRSNTLSASTIVSLSDLSCIAQYAMALLRKLQIKDKLIET
jgi:hypothetical protein